MAKKIIMTVDDEESILQLLSAVFEDAGYEVVTASSGNEALVKLKTVKPDLIILDMMMPGMSGREVCEKIRSDPKTKDTKVAFLTVAKFSEVGKETLSKMNVSEYLTKPFENEELLAKVKKIIE